ncbi:hypothetical protein HJFPF1_04012 [Paramyrothecium foliicola]|nr:hypothetical protein HJFPF1_04012 [Paramyrothecium foliicola]
MYFTSIVQLASFGALLQGASAGLVQVQNVPNGEKRDLKCNADNCARAVTGTFRGLQATRLVDCQAFMQCTVTPVPVTITETATSTVEPATQTEIASVTEVVTVTVTAGSPAKRTVDAIATAVTNCPTIVPTYASACSGTVRYSSACACGGVSQDYTTLSAVTDTVTVTVTETPADVIVSGTSIITVTETATVQPPAFTTVPNPVGRFHLRVKGGPYNGRLAQGSTGSTVPGWTWHAVTGSSAYLTINGEGILSDNGYQTVRHRIGSQGGELTTPYNPADATFGRVVFWFVSNDGGVTMFARARGNSPDQTKIQICPKDTAHPIFDWYWLGSEIHAGCTEVNLEYVKLVPTDTFKNLGYVPDEIVTDDDSKLSVRLCIGELSGQAADGCKYCKLVSDAVTRFHDEEPKLKMLIVGWDTMRIQGLRIVVGDESRRFLYGLDMYGSAGEAVPWRIAKHMERPTEIAGHTGSDAAVETVKSWIKSCCKEHSCQHQQVTRLPRRLLDVSNRQRIFLYCSEEAETGTYACLSHCWGKAPTLRTTTRNICEHEDSIQWDDLPQVFQDAIELVPKLGFRYLWIDSLCIIQDSVQDWQRESAKMADIYANSTVTIAATLAADDTGSLFSVSPNFHVSRVIGSPAFKEMRVRKTLRHGHGPQPLPLMSRAWVLQERLLSPRVVHFTPEELVWECMERTTCECGCIRSLWSPGHVPFDKDLIYDKALSSASRSDLRDRWRRLVEEYSRLELTLDRDRLPAMSGAARRFAAGLGCQYLAGLWRSGLISDLLWERKTPSAPAKRLSSLPSWSWISLGTEVVYEECRTTEDLAVILEAQCHQVDSGNEFGEVQGGTIRLSTIILPIDAPKFSRQRITPDTTTIGNGARTDPRLVLDEPEIGDTSEHYFIKMAYRRQVYSSDTDEELWLVVTPVEDANHTYRRVGLLKYDVLVESDHYDEYVAPEPCIITLI